MNREQTRVLVIDDETSVRKVLRDILATFGFQTDAVADGPAGIEQFRQHGYDVVITDLLMPSMTGVEVAAKLPTSIPRLVILLTGSSSPAVSAEAKRDRLGLLHKPVSPDQLVAAVDRARATS
jgi:CheY-like chemotaxis protein